jgi:RNA polymerase sigma factor (sigma-70 family)
MTSSAETAMTMTTARAENDGNRALVSELHEQRGPELYGFARRPGLSPDTAADAVQESLLRLWATLDSGASVARPDAWLFRALYRICMDHHRWSRRASGLVARLLPRPTTAPETPIADRLTVWDAVDRLPERQRLIVYLRYRADLPYEEIGSVLGINPVSARSQVSRALDRLGALLSREDFR